MPQYSYQCPVGCRDERFLTVQQHGAPQRCPTHGSVMEQIITAPLLVKVAADVRYDSPIDGRPITSHQARLEDMKRHDCVAYDPEMKKDYERRLTEQDDHLDRLVEAHVEETIEKMPTSKRAQLYSEMTEQGLTAEIVRRTPTA